MFITNSDKQALAMGEEEIDKSSADGAKTTDRGEDSEFASDAPTPVKPVMPIWG